MLVESSLFFFTMDDGSMVCVQVQAKEWTNRSGDDDI